MDDIVNILVIYALLILTDVKFSDLLSEHEERIEALEQKEIHNCIHKEEKIDD